MKIQNQNIFIWQGVASIWPQVASINILRVEINLRYYTIFLLNNISLPVTSSKISCYEKFG